jgi:hypothetical protein
VIIDYDNLPDHPVELWTAMAQLEANAVRVASEVNQAVLAPTNGVQDGQAVWVVLVPGAELAYKILLDRGAMQALAKLAFVSAELLGQMAYFNDAARGRMN